MHACKAQVKIKITKIFSSKSINLLSRGSIINSYIVSRMVVTVHKRIRSKIPVRSRLNPGAGMHD